MATSRSRRDGSNGTAPTAEAERLVKGSYPDKVLATIGEQRIMTDALLRATLGEFDPEAISVPDLRRMRRDPVIKMAMHYTKALLIRSEWRIKCKDPVIQAGVTEIVTKVHQAWMRTALNMFDYGYQAAVKQYEFGTLHETFEDPDSGEVRPIWPDDVVQPVVLGRPIPIPPEHARVALKQGRFNGIHTTLSKGGASDDNDPEIPADWALWFVNEFEEEMRNWYGTPRIAPAYEPWYSYWFTHHMRNRHIEQDADPALQVWYPPGTYRDPDDKDAQGVPKLKSNRDAALLIGSQLRGGSTIAWPSDVHISEEGKATSVRLWEAAFLQGGENLGVFNDVLNDLRVEKMRACLVPEEALTEALGGTGSRASAGERVDLFTESLEMSSTYLDEVWSNFQIQPIVEANWGRDAPPAVMETTGFREEDLTFVTDLIKLAFQTDPNALPIKFEDLVKEAGLPTYTTQEQQDREQAAAEAQAQATEANSPIGNLPGEPAAGGGGGGGGGGVGSLPGEAPSPDLQQLAAAQDRLRTKPRKYEREVIHLSSRVAKQAPPWAKREGARRDRNVAALADRMRTVVEARYREAFDAAADVIAEMDDGELHAAVAEVAELQLAQQHDESLELDLGDRVKSLLTKITNAIKERVAGMRRPLESELASTYHASGLAELNRLGLSAESWDVGRDEVQEWARFRAGELIKTIDKTVVDRHVRPWLTAELQNLGIQDKSGVPHGTLELAQQLTEKFQNYPLWMSERVVRTEAQKGYNASAADMWERVGVSEVELYDGLGGRSGVTDEECLARNGQRVSIDEFRQLSADEHPNGTLGAIPVTVSAELHAPDPGVLVPDAAISASIYGVTDDGLILSEDEVGRLMAE